MNASGSLETIARKITQIYLRIIKKLLKYRKNKPLLTQKVQKTPTLPKEKETIIIAMVPIRAIQEKKCSIGTK